MQVAFCYKKAGRGGGLHRHSRFSLSNFPITRSPTSKSIFHQHSQITLKYCSNVIYESGHKLGSLRWVIGASLISYRISLQSLQSHNEKSINLHLQRFIGKSQKPLLKSKQPFTLSCILSHPLQPRHIPNASGHYQPIQ